jgi:hypothetical protein
VFRAQRSAAKARCASKRGENVTPNKNFLWLKKGKKIAVL